MILFCQVWKSVEDNQVSCESGKHGLSVRLDVDPAGSIQLDDKVTLVGKDPKELEMSKLQRFLFRNRSVNRSIQLFQHQLADKTFGGRTEDCSVPGLKGGRQGFVSPHFQTELRKAIMKQYSESFYAKATKKTTHGAHLLLAPSCPLGLKTCLAGTIIVVRAPVGAEIVSCLETYDCHCMPRLSYFPCLTFTYFFPFLLFSYI